MYTNDRLARVACFASCRRRAATAERVLIKRMGHQAAASLLLRYTRPMQHGPAV